MKPIHERDYLCLCTYGHSRSVALARELHSRKLFACAAGLATAPRGMLSALMRTADTIFVMDVRMVNHVPMIYRNKVSTACAVGPDQWSNLYNQELAALVRAKFDEWARHTNGAEERKQLEPK